MANQTNTTEIDRLLEALGRVASPNMQAAAMDAIDLELHRPARTTAVQGLSDSAEMQAFRQALIDGLIRADTVNAALKLVNEVLTRIL